MSTHTVWSRKAHLSPQPRSVSQACGFVATHLSQHGLDYLVPDVQQAVRELMDEVLSLSRTTIDVTIEEQLFCVILTVHDRSATPAAVSSAGNPEAEASLLGAMPGVVDWGMVPDPVGGRSVWVMFALRPPAFGDWVKG
jgi:hypothetical protein